jgi:hypothetical protein
LAQWSSTRRLSAATGYLLDFPHPLICIGVEDLNSPLERFEAEVLSALAERGCVANVDLLLRRVSLDLSLKFGNPEKRRDELFLRTTRAFSCGLDLLRSSSPEQDLEVLEQLRAQPGLISNTLHAWLVDNCRREAVGRPGVASPREMMIPFRVSELAPITAGSTAINLEGGAGELTIRPADEATTKLSVLFDISRLELTEISLLQVLVHNAPNIKNRHLSNVSLANWSHILTSGLSDIFAYQPKSKSLVAGWRTVLSNESLVDVVHLFRIILSGFEFDSANAHACVGRTLKRALGRVRRNPLATLMRCCRAQTSESDWVESVLIGLPSVARLADLASSSLKAKCLAKQLNAVGQELLLQSNLRLEVVGPSSASPELLGAAAGLRHARPKGSGHQPSLRLMTGPAATPQWTALVNNDAVASLYVSCSLSEWMFGQGSNTLLPYIQKELLKRCREKRGVYAVQVNIPPFRDSLEIWTSGDPSPCDSLNDIGDILRTLAARDRTARSSVASDARSLGRIAGPAVAMYGPLALIKEVEQGHGRSLEVHCLPDA